MIGQRLSAACVWAARLSVLACAGLACASAPPSDPWAALDELPAGVDAGVVLDAPVRAFFGDASGPAVRDALARAGLFTQTRRAWTALAATLGYTEREAADALLGGRVVVGWESLTGAGAMAAPARADTRWVLVAEIGVEAARHVRARLHAVPRRLVDGRAVYSVDAGRMGMALVESGGRTRMVLAPNEAAKMLDAVVAREAGDDSLGARARGVLGEVRPGWTALGVVSSSASAQPGVLELRAEGGAWLARFASPVPGPQGGGGAPVGVLEEIGGDALLAVAAAGSPRLERSALGLHLRAGLSARPDESDGPVRLDRGVVLVLREGPSGGRDAGVSALVVVHGRADGRFGERVDRMVSAMIGGDRPPEHRGGFPDAVRVHAIGSEDDGWPGRHGRVAWCFASEDGDRSGVVSIAAGPEGVDLTAPARLGREAWERGDGERDPALVTVGRAAPGRLAEALEIGASNPAFGLARSVEQVEWMVRRREGLLRGEVRVRFAAPGARLGGD